MKTPVFEYASPRTVDEALELLVDEEARPLAGGQSLVPLLAMRLSLPGRLVDLNQVGELATAEMGADGGLRLGAMVRHSDVETQTSHPVIRTAVPFIGHREIRNRGTVGGSIAHADPAAEWPAVAVALDAMIEVQSRRGKRSIAAVDFFRGPFLTALEPGEIVIGVEFPPFDATGWGFRETARRSGDFALAGAIVSMWLDTGSESNGDGRRITHANVTLFAAAGVPLRCTEVEAALVGSDRAAGAEILDALLPPVTELATDIHASAEFRRHLLVVMAQQALDDAWDRAEQAMTGEEAAS